MLAGLIEIELGDRVLDEYQATVCRLKDGKIAAIETFLCDVNGMNAFFIRVTSLISEATDLCKVLLVGAASRAEMEMNHPILEIQSMSLE